MELCWITAAGVRTLTPDEARECAVRDDGVLWAHCDHQDIAGMALLTELVPVRPPDLKVCHVRSPVPLLRAYPDHFFSAMNGLARGSDRRLHFLPVRIFTRPPIVFTVFGPHHAALSAATTQEDLQAVRARLRSAQLRPSSAYELAAAIRLQMLQSQEDLVAEAAGRITELELNVIQLDPVRAEALLSSLFAVRHDLQPSGRTPRRPTSCTRTSATRSKPKQDCSRSTRGCYGSYARPMAIYGTPQIWNGSTCRKCSTCSRLGSPPS
jgi:Mg2+ and Co2+ transporter CorA